MEVSAMKLGRVIRGVFKWGVVAVVGLLGLGVIALAIMGVPKPPSITKTGMGRVGWSPIVENLGEIRRALGSRSLGTWLPDDRGLTTFVPRRVVDFRLHTISAPGAEARFASTLPRNLAGFHTDPDRPYVVYGADVGGNEQYQLYRWDLDDAEPILLTSGDERASFGTFEPEGGRIAYTSTRRNGSDYDVYVLDPMTPDSDRLVLEREGAWSVADWSPVGEALLLIRSVSILENEVHRFDLGTGEVTPIWDPAAGATYTGSVQYSRDGRTLFYSSDRETEFRHLRSLDLASGEETVLSGAIPWDVTSIQQSGDGDFLVVGVNEDGRTRYLIHEATAGTTAPLELPLTGIYSVALHPESPPSGEPHRSHRGQPRLRLRHGVG
jgi:dipeptidyl aminopeptidase/acylaminoacyl peptidase